MDEIFKLTELADKYNFEITIKPSRNIWNIAVRRWFEVNGVKDYYERHVVFHNKNDLDVDFEAMLAETDKDCTEYVEGEQ